MINKLLIYFLIRRTYRYPKGKELGLVYKDPEGNEFSARRLVKLVQIKYPEIYNIGLRRYLMKHGR